MDKKVDWMYCYFYIINIVVFLLITILNKNYLISYAGGITDKEFFGIYFIIYPMINIIIWLVWIISLRKTLSERKNTKYARFKFYLPYLAINSFLTFMALLVYCNITGEVEIIHYIRIIVLFVLEVITLTYMVIIGDESKKFFSKTKVIILLTNNLIFILLNFLLCGYAGLGQI